MEKRCFAEAIGYGNLTPLAAITDTKEFVFIDSYTQEPTESVKIN